MREPRLTDQTTVAPIETVNLGKTPPVSRSVILASDREKAKVVNQIKRTVRASAEYRQYIDYLKKNIDMNACSYFSGINRKEGKKISIEIHHEPFYLEHIASAVLEKQIQTNRDDVNPILLAEEVMKLHYQNKIGLIPISKTIHELVHKDKIFIPLQNVYGKYLSFLEEYEDYISNDVISMLETKLSKSRAVDTHDMSILDKRYVYLEVDGMSFPQLVEE